MCEEKQGGSREAGKMMAQVVYRSVREVGTKVKRVGAMEQRGAVQELEKQCRSTAHLSPGPAANGPAANGPAPTEPLRCTALVSGAGMFGARGERFFRFLLAGGAGPPRSLLWYRFAHM